MKTKSPLTNWRHLRRVRDWQKAEKKRVEEMLDRDRRELLRESIRQLAELEVREGVTVNLSDTVMEPTEEWMSKGETQKFTPKQPAGTVRVIKSVRRVNCPAVIRLHRDGMFKDGHLKACLWYRHVYEKAGLLGRYSGGRLGPEMGNGASKGARFGGAGGHIPMTLEEAYARQQFRQAKAAIEQCRPELFDALVLDDTALDKLRRRAHCRLSTLTKIIIQAADKLEEFVDANEIDMRGIGRDIEMA